jgi:hypothetical protein
VQQTTLVRVTDPTLRVYVVWTPMLTPDFEFTVKRATTWVADARASHYWDRDSQLSRDYGRVLQLGPGMKAWDVYLVYAREAEWKDAPPAPYYFMDKIGLGHDLDGDKLAVELKTLLEGTR